MSENSFGDNSTKIENQLKGSHPKNLEKNAEVEKVNSDPYLREILSKNQSKQKFDELDILQRKQEKTAQDSRFRKIGYYFVAMFLVIIITVGLIYYNLFSDAAKKNVTVHNKSDDKKYASESDAYFNPKTASFRAHNLLGKVDFAYDVIDNPSIKYRLVDNDSNTIVYLISGTNDLGILVGLNVALKGKPTKSKVNDLDIVDVESVQLK